MCVDQLGRKALKLICLCGDICGYFGAVIDPKTLFCLTVMNDFDYLATASANARTETPAEPSPTSAPH
jgi:hypothetical protein